MSSRFSSVTSTILREVLEVCRNWQDTHSAGDPERVAHCALQSVPWLPCHCTVQVRASLVSSLASHRICSAHHSLWQPQLGCLSVMMWPCRFSFCSSELSLTACQPVKLFCRSACTCYTLSVSPITESSEHFSGHDGLGTCTTRLAFPKQSFLSIP